MGPLDGFRIIEIEGIGPCPFGGMLLADLGDKLGFEAQLMTNEAEMANAMASIARGLISLQAFNDELDPELSTILQSTSVDVIDNTLKIALALDPAVVV